MFLGQVSRSHIFLVLFEHIDTFLYQKLNDIVSFILDGIPYWPLLLVVHIVMLGPTTYQKLRRLHVTFTNTVEYRSLPVLITAIDITAVIKQQINDLVISFSRRIEQWDLL